MTWTIHHPHREILSVPTFLLRRRETLSVHSPFRLSIILDLPQHMTLLPPRRPHFRRPVFLIQLTLLPLPLLGSYPLRISELVKNYVPNSSRYLPMNVTVKLPCWHPYSLWIESV